MKKYIGIALLVLVIDQLTKWMIVTMMNEGDRNPVIGEFFSIVSHRNRGAAFGILQNQRWFFLIITVIVVAGIFYYLMKFAKEHKVWLSVALSLLLGGAIGNFVDRALFGEVVDFLSFYFQFSVFGLDVDYPFPNFNVADSAIVTGVIMLLIDALIQWRNEMREESKSNELNTGNDRLDG